jgi:hypothetical protein
LQYYVGENVDGYEYRMIYSFTIDDAAFGGNGFGGVDITGMHNSPAKSGFPDGDVDTEIVSQTVTNTVEVTGVYGSATVADTDTATVSITVQSGGATEASFTQETDSADNKVNDTAKEEDAYFTELADDPLRLDLADAVDSLA